MIKHLSKQVERRWRLQTVSLSGLLMLLILLKILGAACGAERTEVEIGDTPAGDDEISFFLHGSRQYFRGSLSSAAESFNSLINRFGDSPLAYDAGLAVRRINAELSGNLDIAPEPVAVHPRDFPTVAIVGSPAVQSHVSRIRALLTAVGGAPLVMEDAGAPDITLVLYPEGYHEQAAVVADSLSEWLSSHSFVPVQPGEGILSAIAPGYSGIVIVIGTDAVVIESPPSALRITAPAGEN